MNSEEILDKYYIQSDNIHRQQRIAEDEILQHIERGDDIPEYERLDDIRTLQEFETIIEENNAASFTEEQTRIELEEQYRHLQQLQREDDRNNCINDQLSLYESEREVLERAKKRRIVQEMCVICHDNVMNNTVVVDCGHCFCSSCINHWVQEHANCPICRKDISIFIKHRTIRVTFKQFPDFWCEDTDLGYNCPFVPRLVAYYTRKHHEDERGCPWYDDSGPPRYTYGKDVVFTHKGIIINIDETPMSLGLKDGDCIIFGLGMIHLTGNSIKTIAAYPDNHYEDTFQPSVQVMHLKEIPRTDTSTGVKRWKIAISDGDFYFAGMLNSKLSGMVDGFTLKKYSVIKIKALSKKYLPSGANIFCIHDAQVIRHVDRPLGNPEAISAYDKPDEVVGTQSTYAD